MPKSPFLKILNVILAEVPAGRSLVLVRNDQERPCAKLSTGIDWEADHDVCRDIVNEALEAGQPLLIRDIRTHPLFRTHPSVRDNNLASVLCFPLQIDGRAAGAVYMDRTVSQQPFSAGDLEFLAAAAGLLIHLLAPSGRNGVIPQQGSGQSGLPLLYGRDGAIFRVKELIEKVKNTSAPVFISGESGTGKELVARTIHETSSRKTGPFVAVNCGAIPDHLLESELFGYLRGAFTGAAKDKPGLLEAADGGTFFLDEIGDLTLPLQVKLLRVLEEKKIRRLGDNRLRALDVRFISATHKDLEKEVREAKFREDLYYRLKIIPIEIPPLRERKNDLLPLINHFTEKYALEMKRPRPYFSPGAIELLLQYRWPGNVRELQNEIQHCLIIAGESRLIREECLSARINPGQETYADSSRNFIRARLDFEKRFLSEALARCRYHRVRTAAEIGITRQGLFKLMKKHNIKPRVDLTN